MKKQIHPSVPPRSETRPRLAWLEPRRLEAVVGGTGQVIKPVGPQPGPVG